MLKKFFLGFLTYCLYCGSALATIYRCESPTGEISYQQVPCESVLMSQTKIAIEKKTRANTVDKQWAKKTSKEIKKNLKTLEKERKHEAKKQAKARKQREKLATKQAKQKVRCQKTLLKIKAIEQELKSGYQAGRGKTLRMRLQQLRLDKEAVCEQPE